MFCVCSGYDRRDDRRDYDRYVALQPDMSRRVCVHCQLTRVLRCSRDDRDRDRGRDRDRDYDRRDSRDRDRDRDRDYRRSRSR